MAEEQIQEPVVEAGAPEPEPETQEAEPEREAPKENFADQHRTYQEIIRAQAAALATRPKENPTPERDPLQELRAKYGEGPEGEEVFSTITKTAETIAQRAARETEARLRQEYDAKLNGFVRTMSEGQKAQQHLQALKEQGRIDDSGIAKVKQEMVKIVNENPDYANHPEFTRKMAIANVAERGELMSSRPAPRTGKTMPGQPAGERGGRDMAGQAAAKERQDASLDDIARRFPSLGGFRGKPEEMRKHFGEVANTDPSDDELVTLADGRQLPRYVGHGSYSHTR